MELSENNALIPDLPDEAEYPRELTQRYELLECPSEKENVRTLLASNRDNAELCVVKCYLRESPLFDRGEPEALRTIDAAPMPRFLAEYSNEQMRCVLREYVPGETLFQLAKEQVFTEEEVLGIGLQLCDQLHSLHSMEPPVIHRDIKPQNVVLRPDGKAVLIDFGIARVYTEKETDTLVFGTLGFAPPEQYGFSRTDARSDIYSLGILLYWLLHHETKVTRSGRSALEKVIARCTAFDPADRFREVAEVKSALLAARPEAQKKRKRLRIAAACILLALISCGAFFSVRANRRAVSFSQPLIEQAVRLNLGLSDTAPITKDMLGQVTALYIVADAAYPDADSFYPAINRWYAEGKPTRGGVTDLRDLTAMPNLERVGIVAQELSDISALAGQAKLNTVEFKHKYTTDISVLAGMDHLTSVGINDNPVRDISPLAACPNLEFLDLCSVRSYDPAVLAQLGNLNFLDISNPTESYRYLEGKAILDLRLAWSGLDDLHCLDHVTRLERLEIDHTAVSDLSPLAQHKGLKVLKLTALSVTDFSVLPELPQLEEVYVSEEQRPAMEALGDMPFTILYE